MNLLFGATLLVDYMGMCTCLWLGIYLLGRGYPSRVTLRAVVVLLALTLFFLSAFRNLFLQVPGATAWRAVFLIIALSAWLSLSLRLGPAQTHHRLRWLERAIYLWGCAAGLMLLLTSDAFTQEATNLLWVGRMGVGLPYLAYGIFQIAASLAILNNFLGGSRIGLQRWGRNFLLASVFPICAVAYGVLGLMGVFPAPRLIQDGLILTGVFLLGISVALHQTMVERRSTFQDFAGAAISVLLLTALYGMLVWWLSTNLLAVGLLVYLAVFTHSLADLIHEVLERRRQRSESALRRQMRQMQLQAGGQEMLQKRLLESLQLLNRALKADGSFVAWNEEGRFIVQASLRSLPTGFELPQAAVGGEEVHAPGVSLSQEITWLAPVFEGQAQIAVTGIGPAKARRQYTPGDLDLLAEFADRIGTVITLFRRQPGEQDRLQQAVAEVQTSESGLDVETAEMVAAATSQPDVAYLKIVEEALRHLSDIVTLGGSPLAAHLGQQSGSEIEKGQKLQELLIRSIEILRPAGPRPREPLPRPWYNYVILYDAYVECVPNREIMARLYISEGTFNRTRRNALRGLARHLFVKQYG